MNTTTILPTTEPMLSDAIAMYWRLRQHGQTSTLALLSVESRYNTLNNVQRQQLTQLLSQSEAGRL